MSLINDALRKARQQAAEQESRGDGRPKPTEEASRRVARSMLPRQRSQSPGLAIAAVVVLVLGIAIGTILSRRAESEPVRRAEAGEAVAGGVDTSDTSAQSEDKGGGDRSSVPVPLPTPTATPTPAPMPTATPIPRPTATPTPRIEHTAEGLPLYILDAEPEPGVAFHLGYIILTPSWSVANINGRDLHRGETLLGWSVERIAKDEVELEGPAGERIVLRTR